ncbi:putative RNA methylase [Paraburkholderia sp. HC6.4b]|uniref:methyltransferase n=1 Tax=unclassified Paraburkholderia TaxID=2615204 RepID=UPI00160F5F22|nr:MULTISPECIES: methyltransferase [unclassified Paraburkholderia]MBB5409256.1 putative RNA methylase [Paraburkholderia sp. HC6.4b]MBB5450984.1 putative RNA methylase [Paraburkholderia sp. Kb1A]
MKVSQDVLEVLGAASTQNTSLALPHELGRNLYVRTNKVLEAAGGRWNRKAKAHLFDGDAADAIEQIILSGEITIPQDFGYFPTPEEVVQRLIKLADVRANHVVLEPSAGRGNIARALAHAARVDCHELLPENVAALRSLGLRNCNIVQGDFLGVKPKRVYDRIVMNPPFGKRADIHHVRHALLFLAPRGRLVSVMSKSVTFRQDRLASEFRELVARRGGEFEAVPDGAFATSGTLVGTVIVTIPAEIRSPSGKRRVAAEHDGREAHAAGAEAGTRPRIAGTRRQGQAPRPPDGTRKPDIPSGDHVRLPVELPDGWDAEPYGDGDVVIITSPHRRCAVSVSPKWRSFSLGAGRPRRSAIGMSLYSGRNWRANLFTAAVGSLKRELDECAIETQPPTEEKNFE